MGGGIKCLHCNRISNPFQSLNEGVQTLTCTHSFHYGCLSSIWKDNPTSQSLCPMCTKFVGSECTGAVVKFRECALSVKKLQTDQSSEAHYLSSGISTEMFLMGYNRKQKLSKSDERPEEPRAEKIAKKKPVDITRQTILHTHGVTDQQVEGQSEMEDWIVCHRCSKGNPLKCGATEGVDLACGCFFHVKCLQITRKNCPLLLNICPRCNRPDSHPMLSSQVLEHHQSSARAITDLPSSNIDANSTEVPLAKTNYSGNAVPIPPTEFSGTNTGLEKLPQSDDINSCVTKFNPTVCTVAIKNNAYTIVSIFGIGGDIPSSSYQKGSLEYTLHDTIKSEGDCCPKCGLYASVPPPPPSPPSPSAIQKKLYTRRKPNFGGIVLTCNHIFHLSCLQMWFKFKSKNECPNCDKPFVPELLLLSGLPEGWSYTVRATKPATEVKGGSSKKAIFTPKAQPQFQETKPDATYSKELRRNQPPALTQQNCNNCGDFRHFAEQCPNPAKIRMFHISSLGVPHQNKVQFVTEGQVPETVAGDILRLIKHEIGWRPRFTSQEVQMIFSFFFFNFSCWRCCSPYHGNYGCRVQLNMAGNLNRLRKELFRSGFQYGIVTKPCECGKNMSDAATQCDM